MLAIALLQPLDTLEVGRTLCRKSTPPQEWFDFLQAMFVGIGLDIREQLFSRNTGDSSTVRRYGSVDQEAWYARGLRILGVISLLSMARVN